MIRFPILFGWGLLLLMVGAQGEWGPDAWGNTLATICFGLALLNFSIKAVEP